MPVPSPHPPSPAQRKLDLRTAARHLDYVLASLDRTVGNCDACGHYTYANRDHYQMGLEIEAMIRKCERFAASSKL
jgi:hypothetical protein